jgi:hypothetical protein
MAVGELFMLANGLGLDKEALSMALNFAHPTPTCHPDFI